MTSIFGGGRIRLRPCSTLTKKALYQQAKSDAAALELGWWQIEELQKQLREYEGESLFSLVRAWASSRWSGSGLARRIRQWRARRGR